MPDLAELKTIRDYIRWAVSRFNEAGLYYGHGTDSAWDEAVALILHTLHLPPDINSQVLDARITQDERKKLLTLIQKRAIDRVPVPYLTHEAWFAGLAFYVDERVLIPRSPIAEMIESGFSPWLEENNETLTILDLCTGSGCIAIACAKAFPEAKVIASDISTDAVNVSKINILRHEVNEQVEVIQSDLFASIPAMKFDLIVSNPPYVDAEDMASLPKEYLHEPELALAAGEKGVDFAVRIMRDAPACLKPNGILIVEVGNSEHALADLYPEIPFTWLEFERGGGGVFLLTAKQLQDAQIYL